MKNTISLTLPIVVPNLLEYSQITEDNKQGVDKLNSLLEEGWLIKTVSSATSREVIYNTYILEK